MATSLPLGAYLGNPNGNDPVAEAAFESQLASFVSTMGGASPVAMNSFVDFSQDPSAWAASAGWNAWSWTQTPGIGTNVTPVVGVPMSDSKHWADSPAGSTSDDFFRGITNGTYDQDYKGIVDAWASAGFKTVDLRLGWEMNGNFMPWYYGDDAATQSDWVKAFQHLSTLMRSEASADGIKANIVWNPNLTNYSTSTVTAAYPGDAYVDQIAVDAYSPIYPYDLYDWGLNNGTVDSNLQQWLADPVNREHFWSYPDGSQANPTGSGNGFSLNDAIAFAQAHGKPLGIAESGAGGNGTTTGPADDPAFPQWLASELAKAQSMGVSIPYVNVWDTTLGDGDWNFNASKPQEAAAWGTYFGATAAPTPVPALEPSTAGTLSLTVSEDAWQGDAQFTVSVDGVQQGGVQTVTASHAAGQTQVFRYSGSWTGTHQVAIDFLNDAWGGSAATDRNLYVDGISLNGATNATPDTELGMSGAVQFAATDGVYSPPPAGLIVLHVSEDAWQGDAQFTVSVDGVQSGRVYSATSTHASGQSQAVTLSGTVSAGNHAISVNFLNDAWGGSAATDRNLYVDSIDVNGTYNQAAFGELAVTGAHGFAVTTDAASAAAAAVSATQTLVVNLSEDMYAGNAQFLIAVDGRVLDSATQVTSIHSTGQSQAFTFAGAFGVGPHDLAISFLNDAWGGTAATDRNLYIDSVQLNGRTYASATPELFTTSTQHMSVGIANLL